MTTPQTWLQPYSMLQTNTMYSNLQVSVQYNLVHRMMFFSLNMQYALDYIYLKCASYQVIVRLMVSLCWHIVDMINHSVRLYSQIYILET